MKIYLTAIFKTKTEYRASLVPVLNRMVTETRKENACLHYTLHNSIDDENLFFFYEIWENQGGLDAHNKQPYIAAFVDAIDKMLQEQPTIIKASLF